MGGDVGRGVLVDVGEGVGGENLAENLAENFAENLAENFAENLAENG